VLFFLGVKISEIAQRANVSTATVSMVLNNKPGISEATREKVIKIAKELGYSVPPFKKASHRNMGKIQLAIYRKHSKVVSDTPFFHALIEGIESKAGQYSYQLIIKYLSDDSDIDSIKKEIRDNSIDGMLLLGTEMEEKDFEKFVRMDVPVLLLDSCFMNINANYVVIDNVSGLYKATKYLLEKGHREIGYLKSSIPIQNFRERYEGYLKALAEANLTPNVKHTIPLLPTMDGAYEDMVRVLSRKPHLPTAFVADNDIIAFGAMKALKEFNVKIPDEVSIVGFDDMPFCTITEPKLTTINVDKNALGQLAVENLIYIMEREKRIFFKTTLGVTLVERDSVKTIT
jgi:DNA-binding LacI/PurR family transcriptional regulator